MELEMSDIEGKVIAITGASSGIGEAAAKVLAAAGAHIVIGARRTERLEELAGDIAAKGGSVRLRQLDVTDRSQVRPSQALPGPNSAGWT
jgi:NADP-dependent 3-hydroxy acid dehydrogenase YdfG